MSEETVEKKAEQEKPTLESIGKDIVQRYKRLQAARSNWISLWDEIAAYTLPRKENFQGEKTSGGQMNTEVFDSTARDSVRIWASGFMGHLTNPARSWFKLELRNDELMELDGVRDWLGTCTQRLLSIMGGSNFYEQVHEFYLTLAAFGTGGLAVEECEKEVLRYFSRGPKVLLFEEDERGRVQTLYVQFQYTALQAVNRWGENAGKVAYEAFKSGEVTNKFDFVHCLRRRAVYDQTKQDAQNLPYESSWVAVEGERVVEVSGFHEMPEHVARYEKEVGEPYGYSPAMYVLPEIRSANELKKILIRGGAKEADPPIVLPHDGYLMPFDLNPNAVNVKTKNFGGKDTIELIRPGGNFNVVFELLKDDRNSIRGAYAADVFLSLDEIDRRMTATEVSERVAEKLVILGPVVGRLLNELLDPIIDRSFNIAFRKGQLPEMPEALSDVIGDVRNRIIDVKYVSRLEVAQRTSEASSIEGFLLDVGEIGKVAPDAVDNVDSDETVKRLADLRGIDPKLIREPKEVKKIRDARAQVAQLQAALAAAQQAAQTGKTASEADRNLRIQTSGNGAKR